MNALEKVFAMILAAIIMFIVPISYFQIKKDSIIQINVEMETARFTERVAVQGYITKEMYEEFIKSLSETGKLYTVELERKLAAYEPEYRLRTPDEVAGEDDSSWSGTNELNQGEVSTAIPVITDPISTLPLNTETNESVLAAAVDTPASPSHVHTDACYNGSKHLHTGNPTTGGGCYGAYNAGGACGASFLYAGTVPEPAGTASCLLCGVLFSTPSWTAEQWSCNGSPSHVVIITKLPYTITCPSCGWTYTVKAGSVPSSCTATKKGYYNLNCGKKESCYYNGNNEVFPVCSQQVVGIEPTHPIQNIAVNDPLITTVVVTHADGSTTTKACTTAFSTAGVGQNQTATLSYSYTVSGVTYSKTCTITVNIVPRNKTCTHGHIYNLNNDGTDPGCPYCRGWLSSLTVYSPSSGLLKIYHNAGGLTTQGVTLLAVYMDGHSELVYNGYTENLDSDYVGLQTVTIGYKGLTTTLKAEVIRNKKQCDVCGLYYNLFPDDTDPGCPYCKAKVPIFTGNVLRYDAATYKEEIVTQIYEGSGTYYFRKGDTFTVSVASRDKADVTFSRFFRLKIRFICADTIKDEKNP